MIKVKMFGNGIETIRILKWAVSERLLICQRVAGQNRLNNGIFETRCRVLSNIQGEKESNIIECYGIGL